MSARTEPSGSDGAGAAASSSVSALQRKPRLALFIATAGGLGYLPKAPGTFGSLAGLALAAFPYVIFAGLIGVDVFERPFLGRLWDTLLVLQILIAAVVAIVGVRTASRAAEFWQTKDPQRVVIDEVSGQHLTILLGCDLSIWHKPVQAALHGMRVPLYQLPTPFEAALNWKYLVVGFILFRVFDIWKPFPARQAEALPGGWGIMADDWAAGIYAGIGLWIARAAGL
jgi:phosphatidylglycerophosphatase A